MHGIPQLGELAKEKFVNISSKDYHVEGIKNPD
jgi:hypothetical protein